MSNTLPRIAISILFATVMAESCLAVDAADSTVARPTTAGLALAYPQAAFARVEPRMFIGYSYELVIPVDLRVSADGHVAGFSLVYEGDSTLEPLMDSALKLISFVPGEKDGSSVDQIIPCRAHVRPNLKSIWFDLPVSEHRQVALAADYADGLARNGIMTPTVSKFESYAYPNHLEAKPVFLPSIAAKVVLSKSGRPLTIEVLHSTMPQLDEQIRSALNWTTYDVAAVKQQKPLREFYAAIVFHPAAQYPTKKQTSRTLASRRSAERFLFQLLPDTLGLLAPPLPRFLLSDSVGVGEAAIKNYGRVAVTASVDTLGQIEVERVSRVERPVVALVQTAIKQLSFYPALQFDGRPSPFRGLIYFDFEGSTNVRISIDWLRNRADEPIR